MIQNLGFIFKLIGSEFYTNAHLYMKVALPVSAIRSFDYFIIQMLKYLQPSCRPSCWWLPGEDNPDSCAVFHGWKWRRIERMLHPGKLSSTSAKSLMCCDKPSWKETSSQCLARVNDPWIKSHSHKLMPFIRLLLNTLFFPIDILHQLFSILKT